MHKALAVSGERRAAPPAPATLWLLLWLAVALALLNPLACVVHCLPRPITTVVASYGFAAICHIPAPGAVQSADAPAHVTRGQAPAPQAVFAFVVPLPLILLLGMRRAMPGSFGSTAKAQLYVRPLSPPPR